METIKEIINDKEYELIPFGTKKSLQLTSKIASTLSSPDLGDKIKPLDLVIHILGNEDFPDLVEDLCSTLTCNGKKITFDAHFRDNKKDLIPCLGMSLQENILPFFDLSALETLFEKMSEKL